MGGNVSKKNMIILTCSIIALFSTFMGNSINISLPNISEELNIGGNLIGWVINIYTIALSLALLPCGFFADKFGLKKFLFVGTIGFFVTSIACANINSFAKLLILQALQGMFAAMIQSSNMAVAAKLLPDKQRGHALSTVIAFNYAGLASGSFFGGLINTYLSWRFIFYVVATLAGASSILVFFVVDSKVNESTEKRESINLNRQYVFSIIALLLFYAATFPIGYLINVFLRVCKRLNPAYAGYILILFSVTEAIVSKVVGMNKLSDKKTSIARVGAIISFCVLFVLGLLKQNSFLVIIIGLLILGGVGVAFFVTSSISYIYSLDSGIGYGKTSAVLNICRSLGQSIGMGVVNLFAFMFVSGNSLMSAEISEVNKLTGSIYLVMCFVCLLVLFFILFRGENKVNGDA